MGVQVLRLLVDCGLSGDPVQFENKQGDAVVLASDTFNEDLIFLG